FYLICLFFDFHPFIVLYISIFHLVKIQFSRVYYLLFFNFTDLSLIKNLPMMKKTNDRWDRYCPLFLIRMTIFSKIHSVMSKLSNSLLNTTFLSGFCV